MAKFHWLAFSALPVVLGGCFAPPVETPVNTVFQSTPIRVNQNTQNAVDILFMVDNSSSMTAMQTQLQAHFADFLSVFEKLATQGTYADLHIGVVTSDYGAGDVANNPTGLGGCDASPGGQKGLMQTLPASYLNKTGCAAPTDGVPYIQYSFVPGAPNNLPPGQTGTAGLNQTFTCMASVGAEGCGFEHQLESVYQALKQTNALAPNGAGPNGDFLRPDALLAIVFVTNEDDSSSPTNADQFNYMKSYYGYYDTYRQTRWGVECKQNGTYALTPYPSALPGNNPIDLTADGCQGAPDLVSTDIGLEYDISRYTQFFPSLKPNPEDVIMVGIDGPTKPFQIILAEQNTGQGSVDQMHPSATFVLCDTLNPPACAVRLNHSCQNTADPAFFADPPVRLSAVINNGKTVSDEEPICGTDLTQEPDYTLALQKVGSLISSALAPGCVPAKLTNPIDCSVQDVTAATGATPTVTKTIPECNMGVDNTTHTTTGNPTYNGTVPCWFAQTNPQCAPGQPNGSPDGVGITVERGGQSAPPNTQAHVSCVTIATAADGGT